MSQEARLQLVRLYMVPLGPEKVQLRSSAKAAVLSGPIVKSVFPKLFPLLDGSRTATEIVAELADEIPEAKVRQVLAALSAKDFINEVQAPSSDLFPEETAGHYETVARYLGQGSTRWEPLEVLRKTHFAIVGGGPVEAPLVASLAHLGVGRITVIGDAEVSDLDVQQSRYYLREDVGTKRSEALVKRVPLAKYGVELQAVTEVPETMVEWQKVLDDVDMAAVMVSGPILFYPWLDQFNAAALATDTVWTSCGLPDQQLLQIGPTIRPGVTGCYKCFETRFKSNLSFLESYEVFERFLQEMKEPPVDMGFMPPVGDLAASYLTLEIARTLDPEMIAESSGRLMTINTYTYAVDFHTVLKIPRCPACSPVQNMPQERIWS